MLHILEVLYDSKLLFIPYIYSESIQTDSRMLFPKESCNKFTAFELLDDARKYFFQLGFHCESELITEINIDNLVNWVKGDESLKMDYDKIMDFNSFFFDYIMYTSGVFPNDFIEKDFSKIRKLMDITISRAIIESYYDAKIKKPEYVDFDVNRIKTFSDDEIKETIESQELKVEVDFLLSFFKSHIHIN